MKKQKTPKVSKADQIRAANLKAKSEEVERVADLWDEKLRTHIICGEPPKSGGNGITGGHSILGVGTEAIFEIVEGSKSAPDKFGVYSAQIQTLTGKNKKPSTFFPDGWTETQLKNAVLSAYATKGKNGRGVVTTATGRGMVVQFSGDSTAYPVYGAEG